MLIPKWRKLLQQSLKKNDAEPAIGNKYISSSSSSSSSSSGSWFSKII